MHFYVNNKNNIRWENAKLSVNVDNNYSQHLSRRLYKKILKKSSDEKDYEHSYTGFYIQR